MTRFRLALLLLLVVATVGCPPDKPPLPVETTPKTPARNEPDRTRLPAAGPAREWAPPEVAVWTLANGMSVWHLQQDQAPLVSVRLVLARGSSSDPSGKEGLTGLMGDLLNEGAGDRDALTLDDVLRGMGTDMGSSIERDALSLSVSALADQLEPSLAILADVVMRPHLDPAELDRRRSLWAAQAIARTADPKAVAWQVAHRVLYGEGYAGRPGLGTADSLRSIELDDVKRQYKAVVAPAGATLVVVGAVERSRVEAAIDEHFGGWQGAPLVPRGSVAPVEVAHAIHLVDFPDASQSSVIALRRVPGVDAEDYFAAHVFNHSLGGAFASRLNLNLREDKGYTYGARSVFSLGQSAGIFALYAHFKRETTRGTIDEMLFELSGMGGDRPLTETERNDAVQGLLLGFPSRFERIGSIAGELASQATVGRDAHWLRAWPTRIRAVEHPAARLAAERYCDPTAFAFVVVGDAAVVRPNFTGLTMDVLECDRDGVCSAPD